MKIWELIFLNDFQGEINIFENSKITHFETFLKSSIFFKLIASLLKRQTKIIPALKY